MKLEPATTANTDNDAPRLLADAWRRKRVFLRLAFAACLALMAGCASVGTSVGHVWHDSGRAGSATLGKTLVLALAPKAEVVMVLEDEWVRQLRQKGIDASAANPLLPGESPPDKERVVALVKARGFDTLLVSRLVDVKEVEREVSAYQVGVVETTLYDAGTERKFWSARADTFLINPTGERIIAVRGERARDFVQALVAEMSESKLL